MMSYIEYKQRHHADALLRHHYLATPPSSATTKGATAQQRHPAVSVSVITQSNSKLLMVFTETIR